MISEPKIFKLLDSSNYSHELKEQELCATIEIKINYYKPVRSGNIVCTTDMINRGKSIANLESAIYVDNMIVAKANGNFSIFTPSNIKVDA